MIEDLVLHPAPRTHKGLKSLCNMLEARARLPTCRKLRRLFADVDWFWLSGDPDMIVARTVAIYNAAGLL